MNASAPSDLLAQSLIRIHTALRRSLESIVRVSAAPVPEGDRADFADFCERFTRFLHTHHDGEEQIIFPKLTEVAARASLPAYASNVTGWRADEVLALEVATSKHGQRVGGPSVLMLLVHSLTDAEQNSQRPATHVTQKQAFSL